MKLGGRLQAVIEILDEIEIRQRPALEALQDWGRSHRFAGSGDRAEIGNLVHDALRRKLSIQHIMGAQGSRYLAYGVLLTRGKYSLENLHKELANDNFSPKWLTEREQAVFDLCRLARADGYIRVDIPAWIAPAFEKNFGKNWVTEARALRVRAPFDLRVNTLITDRDKMLHALSRIVPTARVQKTAIAKHGIRIQASGESAKIPNICDNINLQRNWFEVQDEGSQIVAALVHAQPENQILDFCAGSGGKTLALACAMKNRGQIYAYDNDAIRLKPIHQRLRRTGIGNVMIKKPGNDLSVLMGRMDRVVVDAPCTGSGTWRRRPDSKWRLSPIHLEKRLRQQAAILGEAARFVRRGGYLIYMTCSLLSEENESQIGYFLKNNPYFKLLPAGEIWDTVYGKTIRPPLSPDHNSLILTPNSTNTDGFFFAVMENQTLENTP